MIASCLKEIQHFTTSWRDVWSLNEILSGEIRSLLSCATFPFKILLIIQTLNTKHWFVHYTPSERQSIYTGAPVHSANEKQHAVKTTIHQNTKRTHSEKWQVHDNGKQDFFKVYGLLPKIKILLCLISFFLCVPLRFRIFFWQRNKKVDTRDPKFPGGSFYNFILCWWTLSTVGSIIFFRGQCPPPSTVQWVNVHKGSSQKNINQLSWGGSLSQTVPSTAVQNVICTDTESNSQAVLEIGRDGPASAIVHKWQQSRAIQMAKRKEGFVSVVRRNVF